MVQAVRNAAFGTAVLIASLAFRGACHSAFGQQDGSDLDVFGKRIMLERSPEGKALVKERDRLWEQAYLFSSIFGKPAEAIPEVEAVVAAERKDRLHTDGQLASLVDRLANLYLRQEDFAKAEAAKRDVLEILKKPRDETHWKVVDARLDLQEIVHQAALTPGQRQKLKEGLLWNENASWLCDKGKFGEAVEPARQAVAILREVLGERHRKYALSLNTLALALREQGDYAAARPLYERVLAIDKDMLGEHHPEYPVRLVNLAALLHAQYDLAGARRLYERALAIYEAMADRHNGSLIHLDILGDPLPQEYAGYATVLNNLGLLLIAQRDYAAAKPLLEKALAVRTRINSTLDVADSTSSLGSLFQAQGDYPNAKRFYERTCATYKEYSGGRHPNYAKSLMSLGSVLEAEGDHAAARRLYEQALAIFKEALGERSLDYADSLSKLGLLLWAQGDSVEAAKLLRNTLEVVQDDLELAAAAQSERQQLSLAQVNRGKLDLYLSLAQQARLAPGEVYSHVVAFKGAILERQQRLRVLRRGFRKDPKSQASQRFAEYDSTVKQLATLALTAPHANLIQSWREQLAALALRKDELEAELAQLDTGFRAERAATRCTPEQLQAAIAPNTALLDLLVYTNSQPVAQGRAWSQVERRVVAFVARQKRPIARVDLGRAEPILKAIDEWRRILAAGQAINVASDPALALRRLVWDPLAYQLAGIATVLISPDDALAQIPFSALPGSAPGRYLIEERLIVVVPVPRMLVTTAVAPAPPSRQGNAPGRAEPTPSLLVLGDVDYEGDSGTADLASSRSAAIPTRSGSLSHFSRLPATGDEIASISRYFRSRFRTPRTVELVGKKATEEAFREAATQTRYLHLATHGYFAPEELRSALGPKDANGVKSGNDALGGAGVTGYHPGLLSGIALAGANRRPTPDGKDDGILTAMEVAELDLSGVELVALSACETGLGEVAGGEGLLGLQRAFQVADARTVIATLWSVNDESTRMLMTEFYRNLWERKLPKGEALRQAQIRMLRGELRPLEVATKDARGLKRPMAPRGYRKPYYWAAFVLSGDWR